MNNDSKIKFYSLDNMKVSKIEFNKVLDELTKKDIKFLSNKVKNTIKQINKKLESISIECKIDNNYSLENIENLISNIKNTIMDLIKEKEKIKVGLFSLNKQDKRNNIEKYEDVVSFLSKKQNDILAVKDEYNKIINRRNAEKTFSIEEEEIVKKDEDPLLRTINFYTKKIN